MLSLLWGSVPPFPAHTQSFPLSYEHMYKQQRAARTLIQNASWLPFDPLLLPLNSTEKFPLILIWAGTNLLTSSMYVSWVAFFPWWLWGGSLIIFSAKTVAAFFSFDLPVYKQSQHSFFHNTQIKNQKVGRKEKNRRGKEGHRWSFSPIECLLLSFSPVFSTAVFYFTFLVSQENFYMYIIHLQVSYPQNMRF